MAALERVHCLGNRAVFFHAVDAQGFLLNGRHCLIIGVLHQLILPFSCRIKSEKHRHLVPAYRKLPQICRAGAHHAISPVHHVLNYTAVLHYPVYSLFRRQIPYAFLPCRYRCIPKIKPCIYRILLFKSAHIIKIYLFAVSSYHCGSLLRYCQRILVFRIDLQAFYRMDKLFVPVKFHRHAFDIPDSHNAVLPHVHIHKP